MTKFNKIVSITNKVLSFTLTLVSVIAAGLSIYNNDLLIGILWLIIFGQNMNATTFKELSDKISLLSIEEKESTEK